jgi:glycine/D-amino acid oxidase-like deaminating enzyme
MDISVWEKESFYEACDVLIVGAGLLGLWTARELKIKDPKLKVTLIERSPVPTGASTRNAGFACFGSPSEMIHDLTMMPADTMWGIVEMRFKGIQKIRQTLTDEQTGYEPLGGYECFLPGNLDKELLDNKLEEINAGMKIITGEQDAFTDASAKMTDYGLRGFTLMLENRLEGGLHSGLMVESLTGLVKKSGVRILNGFSLDHYETSPLGATVFNEKGGHIKSKLLLLATNAFLSVQAPQLSIVPARGQIILSPPIEGLALRGTFHFDGGYYYFRNLGNRVLLGGARNASFDTEQTIELETTEFVKGKLYEFLQSHIPQAAQFPLDAFESWGGLMAMHSSKQPVLKQIEPGVWAAMCCNGMGVALSPVFSENVAASIIIGSQ